jgi:protein-tyrosine-phosphatase
MFIYAIPSAPEMATQIDPAARAHIERGADLLADEFAGVFSRETIARYVDESIRDLSGARITDFVPLFVERFTRERLRALAHIEGRLTTGVPEVLFVCVHNAGRSQMAAGLLSQLAEGRVNVRTAGSEPADRINPTAVEAMEEVGIDISEEFPKPLTSEFVRAADVVITMGCGDACPIYPGKRYEDWELEDPEGKDLATVRQIRDEIESRVKLLLTDLLPDE